MMTNIIGSILLIVDAFGTDFGLTIAVPFSNDVLVKVVTSGILINQSLIRFLSFGYMVVIVIFLTMTLEELNKFLENLVTENCFDMPCEFRRIRLLHLNFSKMISFIDKEFSYYFAFVFAFGMGLLCYNLYQIVRTPMSTVNLLMTTFWLIATLALLGISSVLAALVNEAVGLVHSRSTFLYGDELFAL